MKLQKETFKIVSKASRVWYEQGRQEEALLHSHQKHITKQLLALFESAMMDEVIGEDEYIDWRDKTADNQEEFIRNEFRAFLRKKVKEMIK